MTGLQEIEQKNKSLLPATVYHMVPQVFFSVFVGPDGSYDCRYKQEWGKSAPYIHTTTDLKNLQYRVSNKWRDFPKNWVFYLLEINTSKISASTKITYADYNGIRYFHIWNALPAESFTVSKVTRTSDGNFILV